VYKISFITIFSYSEIKTGLCCICFIH